ncbi:hypothetical protein GCM10009789_71540 [Kribbella sancticallisti]|uniref:Tetratricopeptide repeat protein n=1 Tax=Kribbella sancticallisti TaxID=460087 RepID=A0ABP4QFY1_9ACTN
MLWPLRWRTARSAIKVGDRLYLDGKVDTALRAFRRAADSGSYHGAPAGAWWTATVLREQQDREGARSYYERAIASGHEAWAPRAATDLAGMFEEQGQVAKAAGYYRQAIAYGDRSNPSALWARRAQEKLDALLRRSTD